MADLAQKLIPIAEALLEPGETLVGCCVATWQKTFTGGMYAIAVAPRRVILQKLDRRFSPTGEPVSLTPEGIAHASVENGIGGTLSIPSLIMDAVAISVVLSPTQGERLRFSLMGSGGQVQHDGIAALLTYLEPLLEPNS